MASAHRTYVEMMPPCKITVVFETDTLISIFPLSSDYGTAFNVKMTRLSDTTARNTLLPYDSCFVPPQPFQGLKLDKYNLRSTTTHSVLNCVNIYLTYLSQNAETVSEKTMYTP